MARRKRGVNVTRVMKDIRQLRREFNREISAKLSEALGFPVRVTPVKTKTAAEPLSPIMRRAQRLTRKQAMVQVREAFAPPPPAKTRRPSAADMLPIDKSGLTGL